jgi:hypothetical protein
LFFSLFFFSFLSSVFLGFIRVNSGFHPASPEHHPCSHGLLRAIWESGRIAHGTETRKQVHR